MSPSIRPKSIAAVAGELAVAWSDGSETYFPLEFLRRACPCAVCGGEPDVLGRLIRPEVKYSEKSFRLNRFEFVGGYAMQPEWADGHRTGIYSWQYLQRLAEELASQ